MLISTRIHADEVFEGEVFSDSVPYKSLFFLRKTGAASRQLKLNPSNYESVASEIMMSADLNQSLYDLVGDKIKEEKIKNLEIKTITRLLSQMGSLVYINTRKLDLNNLDSFINKSF